MFSRHRTDPLDDPDDELEALLYAERQPPRTMAGIIGEAAAALTREAVDVLLSRDEEPKKEPLSGEPVADGSLPSLLVPAVMLGMEALTCWAIGRGSSRLFGGLVARLARRRRR
jgi:hypothetical protein